jgi:hypothetical protein
VPLPPKDTQEAKVRQRAERFAQEIEKRSEFLRQQIALSQSRMEEAVNKSRQPSPNYQPGDFAWLDMKNIKTLRPTKKLDHKNV